MLWYNIYFVEKQIEESVRGGPALYRQDHHAPSPYFLKNDNGRHAGSDEQTELHATRSDLVARAYRAGHGRPGGQLPVSR